MTRYAGLDPADFEPEDIIGYDGFGAPIYAYQLIPVYRPEVPLCQQEVEPRGSN